MEKSGRKFLETIPGEKPVRKIVRKTVEKGLGERSWNGVLTVFEAEVGRQVPNHEGCNRVQPLRLPDASVNHGKVFAGGRGIMDVAVGISRGKRFTPYLQSRRKRKRTR